MGCNAASQFAFRIAYFLDLLVHFCALLQPIERVDQLLLQAYALSAQRFVLLAGALDAVGYAGERGLKSCAVSHAIAHWGYI